MPDETMRAVVQFEGETTQAESALQRIEALLTKIEATSARTEAAWKSVIQTMGETGAVRIVGMDKLLQSVEGIQAAMSAGIGVSREYASGMEGVATRAKSTAQAQREAAKATQELSTAQSQSRAYWSLRRELMPTEAAQDPFEGVWALRGELQTGGVSDAYQMAQLTENEQVYIDAIHRHGQALSARAMGTQQATEAEEDLAKATESSGKAMEKSGGIMAGLGRSFQVHLRWMARYIILWKGMQLIQSTAEQWFQVNMELDRSLALLETSIGGNTIVMREYREAIFAAAQAGRALPTEMAPAAVMTGRIFDPAESQAAMTRAAELAFISGGKVADITGTLIVMQRQLGLESEQMGSVMDALAGSLRNTHLTYADLVPMLDRAVTYSKRYNMTVEETIGLQAGVASATGATGSQLDSLMRRLQDIYVVGSDANLALGRLGVSTVMVAESGEQIRRPMIAIFEDIARAIGDDQAAIEALSKAMFRAGSTARADFEAVIANQHLVTQGYHDATQAAGEWDRALERMGATWAGATQELAGAWQELLASLKLDTEITDQISEWASGLGDVSEAIRYIIDAWEDLQEIAPGVAGGMQARGAAFAGGGLGGPVLGGMTAGISNRLVAGILQRIGAIPGIERGVVGEQVTYPREPLGGMGGAGGPQLPSALDVRTMVLEVPEGADFGEVMDDYVANQNKWIQTFVDSQGQSWRISREMLTDAEEQVLMWDEASGQMRLLNVFLPALQEAIQENTAALKAPSLRFTPFDPVAGAGGLGRLVSHYERIAKDLGWDEKPQDQVLWGPDDSILQLSASNIALQLVMHSLTEAVEDNTAALNEGMWNIPEGVSALVPITSLFYQNLKKPGADKWAGVDIAALADEIIGRGTTVAGTYGDEGGVGGGRTRSFFTGGPTGELTEAGATFNQAARTMLQAGMLQMQAARTPEPYDIYLPPIPKLTAGGIVTGPTLAMIGDQGPEAVMPLGQSPMAGQPVAVNITLMMDKRILAEFTREAIAEAF